MVDMAERALLSRGLLQPGDVLGVVAGTRQASGATNFMRLHSVIADEANAVPHSVSNSVSNSPRKHAAARKKL
jgi:hypothetical protein